MKTYCVTYRMGGPKLFTWKRTFPKSKENADKDAEDIKRMGYHALVVDFQQSMAIGLPSTWDKLDSIELAKSARRALELQQQTKKDQETCP